MLVEIFCFKRIRDISGEAIFSIPVHAAIRRLTSLLTHEGSKFEHWSILSLLVNSLNTMIIFDKA